MTWVSVGTGAVSAIVGAVGTYVSVSTNKKVAEHNADIAEIQAQDAIKRGEKDAIKTRQQGNQVLGAQRAAFAARGLDLQAGTAGDLLDQTAFFSLTDQATDRRNAANEAWAKRAQSANFEAEGKSLNPALSSAGSALGGASSVADKWYKYGSGS